MDAANAGADADTMTVGAAQRAAFATVLRWMLGDVLLSVTSATLVATVLSTRFVL